MQDDNDKKRFKNHQHQIVAKLAKDGYFEYNEVIKIHHVRTTLQI